MLFQVKAVRGDAEIVTLPIEAVDAGDAARLTEAQGYGVLAVKARQVSLVRPAFRRERFPLLAFTQELVALLEAGLNLVAALEALAEKESSPSVRQVIDRLIGRLREGASFSDLPWEFRTSYCLRMAPACQIN